MVIMVLSAETLLGKSPASQFLKTSFGQFASILQTKLGIPVLSICCPVGSSFRRSIMKEVIECYNPHTVVVDNATNKSTRAWPPLKKLTLEWCHSFVVEAESSCLVQLATWNLFKDNTHDGSENTIKTFDLNCVRKSVCEWRASSELLDILALGIGLIPGQTFQPEIQKLLLQTDDDSSNCVVTVPHMLLQFFSGTADASLLSLDELLSNASTRVDKSTNKSTQVPLIFRNGEGSESSALLAVSTLIRTLASTSSNHGAATWAESSMRMLDCNPNQVGQEQLMNYLNIGSLSPRVLVDLVLGHRAEHRREPYQWMEWLTHPDQCVGTCRGRGLFEHVARVSECASYCIYNSITCREFAYLQFFESLQQSSLNAVSSNQLAPLTSRTMWKTLVCGADVERFVLLSTEHRLLVGSLECGSTSDEVFNILQFRLVTEGQIHPVYLKPWIFRAERLLHNPFLSFDFVITMLRKYHLGASQNFDFVLGIVVRIYQNKQVWKETTMVAHAGREFWESLKRKHQCSMQDT
jgi:hypothetical protein